MEAPTDYVTDSVSYTSAGFIYVAAGCRGRDAGAPAGVTDLKAAIRYIRYNDGVIPGDVDRIFSFGMSGGGARAHSWEQPATAKIMSISDSHRRGFRCQ